MRRRVGSGQAVNGVEAVALEMGASDFLALCGSRNVRALFESCGQPRNIEDQQERRSGTQWHRSKVETDMRYAGTEEVVGV